MISEELKQSDNFANGRLEKILALNFMSEELLDILVEDFPPAKGKWKANVKELTAWSQNEWITAHPQEKHERDNGNLVALYIMEDQRQKGQ